MNHTCPDSADTGVAVVDKTGLSIPLPTGDSTHTIPGLSRMAADALNGCQGRSFMFPVIVRASTP